MHCNLEQGHEDTNDMYLLFCQHDYCTAIMTIKLSTPDLEPVHIHIYICKG